MSRPGGVPQAVHPDAKRINGRVHVTPFGQRMLNTAAATARPFLRKELGRLSLVLVTTCSEPRR